MNGGQHNLVTWLVPASVVPTCLSEHESMMVWECLTEEEEKTTSI